MLTPHSSGFQAKVALYRTTSIGDVVLATACLDLLERLPVAVAATWIGREPSLGLLSAAYPAVNYLPYAADNPAQTERLIDAVKGCHLVVDLQTTLRSSLFCRALRKRHGVPFYSAEKHSLLRMKLVAQARLRGRARPLPAGVRKNPYPQYRMMLDALWRGLAQHLPKDALSQDAYEQARPFLPLAEEEELRSWQKELRYGRWLAVAPGAAHATKQAPLSVMINILEGVRAATQGRLNLVFLGDEKDREVARRMEDHLRWPGGVLNLAGKLPLVESALALRETAVVLTNDSSLAHIAEAVGTPATVLFGPTVEAFGFTPWRDESRTFSDALGCRPCSRHGKAPCRYGDKKCFQDLPFAAVVAHLARFAEVPG